MDAPDLTSPAYYVNRELSWLQFNRRVLAEGRAAGVPLMERVRFLGIVSSNMDEFFMIRVAGLRRQARTGSISRDPSGLTPAEQLEQVSARVQDLMAEHSQALIEALGELAGQGLRVLNWSELNALQRSALASYFQGEVLPVLTPLAVGELEPFPALAGLGQYLAVELRPREEGSETPSFAVVPVPANLPRFASVRGEEEQCLVPLEQVIGGNVGALFPEQKLEAWGVFRITRDGDVWVDEDEAGDLLEATEEAVRTRSRRNVVRLEVSAEAAPGVRAWLQEWLELSPAEVYETPSLLPSRHLFELASRPGFEHLHNDSWPPQVPRDLLDSDDPWQALRDRDALLFHPYESFEPVVSLVEAAADDADVLAIKITLYRTGADSPVVAALLRAAEKGKQVTVLVELKARFDEARNVTWARRLEEAGCHVIYGIAGLKTHAKLLLIIRREPHGIRRYVHCSTGNYNDSTARLYSDIGLLTTDRGFAVDAASFFNLLTGYSQEVGWSRFAIAPTGLRERFLELIQREMDISTPDQPGLIMAKMNSLQDTHICRALYRASQAGVRVRLNVRGLCCLRPGVPGVSDGIEVISVIDRFLEHARLFAFGNGGHEEVYLSSADWMERNLDRRLEVLFPVLDPALRRRLFGVLETLLSDNTKGWRMLPDGRYERVTSKRGPQIRSQEAFYREAVQAAKARHTTGLALRPLVSPETR
jgi:polyphosphate kinase